MIYCKNTSINAKLAPIVKWHNMSMVRINFKFDSWWGHHKDNPILEQIYKKLMYPKTTPITLI